MTENAPDSPPTRPPSILLACLLLSLALLLAFPLVAWFGYQQHGDNGIWAAAAAAAICWAGATIALLVVALFRGSPQQMVGATLSGMFFRMGMPLVAGVLLTRAGGPLAEAGVFGMILVFYLVGLAVETVLSVRILGSSRHVAKAL